MDFDRNSMTVPVQSSDYTKKFLQKGSNPTTMEVVTQTNAVKSPKSRSSGSFPAPPSMRCIGCWVQPSSMP